MRNHYIVPVLSVFCLLFSFNANSQSLEKVRAINGGALGEQSLLANVVKQGVLVQREKQIQVCDNDGCHSNTSDLRVSYVLVDGGPSTDVSPRYVLYLTTYNFVNEFASATSTHRIAYIDKLYDVERLKAGIYKFRYKGIASDGSAEDIAKLGCFYHDVTAIVDASDLTANVRRANKLKFFEDAEYFDPIYLSVKDRKCSKE